MIYTFLNIFKRYGKELFILILAFIFLNKFKDANLINTEIKEDLDDDEKFTQTNATITDIQAKTIADNFYNAAVTEGLSDTLTLIKPLFKKLQNQNDFNKVFNAFGKRQYSMFWGNMGDPLTSSNRDLIEILTNELKVWEQEIVMLEFPSIKIF